MRISDWSSDVCSSDLVVPGAGGGKIDIAAQCLADADQQVCLGPPGLDLRAADESAVDAEALSEPGDECDVQVAQPGAAATENSERSEEHTSELQSLMRISYAVFCLKKKHTPPPTPPTHHPPP